MAPTVLVINPKCRRTPTSVQSIAWLFATLALLNLVVTTQAQEIGELYAFRKGHLIEYHVLSRATEVGRDLLSILRKLIDGTPRYYFHDMLLQIRGKCVKPWPL